MGEKGFSEEFRQLIDEIYGNKGITEAQYNNIVEKSKSNTYDLDFEDLFDEILVPDEVVLTTDEKSELIHRYDSGVMCPGAEDSKKRMVINIMTYIYGNCYRRNLNKNRRI